MRAEDGREKRPRCARRSPRFTGWLRCTMWPSPSTWDIYAEDDLMGLPAVLSRPPRQVTRWPGACRAAGRGGHRDGDGRCAQADLDDCLAIPVVLGSGVQARNPLLTQAITRRLAVMVPGGVARVVDTPPVTGAALLALVYLGTGPAAESRRPAEATTRSDKCLDSSDSCGRPVHSQHDLCRDHRGADGPGTRRLDQPVHPALVRVLDGVAGARPAGAAEPVRGVGLGAQGAGFRHNQRGGRGRGADRAAAGRRAVRPHPVAVGQAAGVDGGRGGRAGPFPGRARPAALLGRGDVLLDVRLAGVLHRVGGTVRRGRRPGAGGPARDHLRARSSGRRRLACSSAWRCWRR